MTPSTPNSQKKRQPEKSNPSVQSDSTPQILSEIERDISEALGPQTIRYAWMIPVMVVLVVGATIYLAVLERKTEYVYSLATACFGYYFGNMTNTHTMPPKTQEKPLHGVEELSK